MSDNESSSEPGGSTGVVRLGNLAELIDLSVLSVSEQEVVAEMPVSAKHHQPMGIVHGGVYCAIIETICSVGAQLHASKRGLFVVGVDNSTSFLKATRQGTLRGVARPISLGRRTQLWEAQVHDERGTLVATGRVRLMALEPDVKLGGKAAGQRAGS